jgi:histidyl-tRNA synthetase
MSSFEPLPGFRDFYPEDCQLKNFIFTAWRSVCRRHNFAEYDAPILQPTELFTGKSGPEIVSQLFNFTDKGGREVTLRPEMTPYLCQMIAAKAASLRRPLRWFCIAECFRYERPQKGRLRSFYQLNADIFDEASTTAEAELISLAVDIFTSVGMTAEDFAVRLSDRTLWLTFLSSLGYDSSQSSGVLQIIDKWERESPEEIQKKIAALVGSSAGQLYSDISGLMAIQDIAALEAFFAQRLSGDSLAPITQRLSAWHELMADLELMGVGKFIRVDLSIVRGLAYYTGFVFEVFELKGKSRALAGGGRYDDLIKKLGGPQMPAFGFGLGDVTFADALRNAARLPTLTQGVDLFLAYGSAQGRQISLPLATQLRQAGFSVELPMRSGNIGKQLKQADKAAARYAIILGDEEIASGNAKIKCLNSGDERAVPLAHLVNHLLGR